VVAQEMAFEGYVTATGYGNPRLLQRLVQTGLIYGNYPVVGKYLDILSKTLMYRRWAADYRRFLYDDGAIEADPLLHEKRKCIAGGNRFFETTQEYLEEIARQNPESTAAIEYLGSILLLTKNLEAFRTLVESNYGTGVIPSPMPLSFQEAMVSIYENDPEASEKFGVTRPVIERFREFRKRFIENSEKSGVVNIMRGTHGDTFWFYYIFK
jgi:hypothetical protein